MVAVLARKMQHVLRRCSCGWSRAAMDERGRHAAMRGLACSTRAAPNEASFCSPTTLPCTLRRKGCTCERRPACLYTSTPLSLLHQPPSPASPHWGCPSPDHARSPVSAYVSTLGSCGNDHWRFMHPFSVLTLGIFVAGYITARWDLVTRLYELAIFAWDHGVVVCKNLPQSPSNCPPALLLTPCLCELVKSG